ncbi:sulfite dehydrogenase [Spongorhabdus nitratireducens]
MTRLIKNIKRRELLRQGVTATGALLAASALQANGRYMGPPVSVSGERAAEVNLKRQTLALTHSFTPLQQLHGIITPSDLHFERHHSGVPDISEENYKLLLHGLVERPLKFTLAELKRFPAVSRICFIECAGNCQDYFSLSAETTAQRLAGQTSQSEWTGVALSTLLKEAGLRPGAKWLLMEGGDAALMTRSVTLEKAMDDAIIAYAQNGEPVRPSQGYPVRLVLPGWEGSSCVKWLRRIEVGDQPWMTREETAKYTDPLKDGTVRQFSCVMDARSIITSPTFPQQLEKGWHEIRGLAWSGRGRISKVEVSVDGGGSWEPAELQQPVLDKAYVRFRKMWQWDGKERLLLSRATDETGYIQPRVKQLIDIRGQGSLRYHNNGVIGWRVNPDGSIYYDPVV